MKKVILFFLCIVCMLATVVGSAAPGEIIRSQTLGGSAEEWGYSLDSTADGGMVIVGVTYSMDGNITGAHGNGDLWAVRLNSDGIPLWNRAFGGNESDYGLSVKSVSDGGSIIIGTTGSNSGDISGYHGNGDLLLLRLSSSGTPVWQKVYGGNRTDEGGDILQTPDGGYILTGYTMSDDGDVSGHHGGGDLWMIRLDSSGSILWQRAFGGSRRDSGSSIVRTKDGGYVMAGNTYSSDGDVTENHGSSDVWVVKTDENGNLLWQKTYGGSQLDWGHSVSELPNGDLLVAGVTASADGNVSKSHGAGDIWVLRLTPGGNLIWEKTYGGSFSDNVWNIRSSQSGTAYLTGETFSVDGDITKNQGDADLYLSEIDGNGTVLWQRTIGGSNYESGSWVGIMPDGNIVVCGTTQSDDGDVSGYKGDGDLWIVTMKGGSSPSSLPPALNSSPVTSTTPETPAISNTSSQGTIPVTPGITPPAATNVSSVNNTTSFELSAISNTTSQETMPVIPDITLPAAANASPANNTTPLESPVISNTTSQGSMPMIPGIILPPGDPDGDGRYEDLNGNGILDLQDSTVFFSNYDWIVANFPPLAADFNENGQIDFGDINALFAEVSR